ncbi:hypothetical protein ACEYYB_08045 [Paracoccus sp. p4-l81]|uniref:hypothetical protein n=1 Tax=Paracoccus sp. p4-l81 TaxID=3342806 RepID=UPI0035B806B8
MMVIAHVAGSDQVMTLGWFLDLLWIAPRVVDEPYIKATGSAMSGRSATLATIPPYRHGRIGRNPSWTRFRP